ncbi:GATA transcription factor LreB [Aspergillus saccharolyticus JOP 1030-1]|uniref:Putative cutinase gene palindrome-binding protein n=1 Tax=Aspergillus saccharolyticus JOP 1030-1 TaxID=1450539 RepID=A0A318ZIW7_9EURO|nr:putative cutinase gene palindrome-binding protein [Aspergillus saccharolyticus JOP 1030-1]PYH46727.1 putative cutinase gene palindrome-binding protein [Aspergillus saccharolyticus JOP 1030-1]
MSNGNGNGEDWAQRTLAEMRDLTLLLSPDGRVLYASPSCAEITGFEDKSLENHDLFRYVHEDDKSFLTQELKESIQTRRLFRCHFRFCKLDSSFCLLEAHGHPHIAPSDPSSMPIGPDGGIFLVCRPYPTRGAQLLNSFLEHKIENIRLSQRIAQLKEEEEEELNATQQSFSSSSNHNHNHHNNRDAHIIHTSTTTTRQTYITTTQTVTQSTLNRMPPARDTPSSSGEDNESSDTVTSNADDDRSFPGMEGVVERLPSVDDTSHIEGIEVMTGLYYGEGERSQGLSTGQKHGRLVHCSNLAGENDPQSNRAVGDADRRKRLKGEYMCTDCGTSDSPEWRKGPEGPKTLCNACGLRWAKREKKRQDP